MLNTLDTLNIIIDLSWKHFFRYLWKWHVSIKRVDCQYPQSVPPASGPLSDFPLDIKWCPWSLTLMTTVSVDMCPVGDLLSQSHVMWQLSWMSFLTPVAMGGGYIGASLMMITQYPPSCTFLALIHWALSILWNSPSLSSLCALRKVFPTPVDLVTWPNHPTVGWNFSLLQWSQSGLVSSLFLGFIAPQSSPAKVSTPVNQRF